MDINFPRIKDFFLFKGVTNGVAAVLPSMVARGNGHIVNISSDSGRFVSISASALGTGRDERTETQTCYLPVRGYATGQRIFVWLHITTYIDVLELHYLSLLIL